MIRICGTLAEAGYEILLLGVKKRNSVPIRQRNYRQKRLNCLFSAGPGFYAEYNTRLFFFLLFHRAEAVCAIDIDTIMAVWLASVIRRTKRIYDAHEYFSQQKEIIARPGVYRVWHWIERNCIPKFKYGYTVSDSIATEFKNKYGANYAVIKNMPLLKTTAATSLSKEKNILYRGAVNEARGFEFLLPAMREINARLIIYGDGNFIEPVKELIRSNNLQDKVLLKGKLLPEELDQATDEAHIGINLVENTGFNQYYSLANKFFDYIHHAIPQVTMNFPEYKNINAQYEVAVLIDDLQIETITAAINTLLNDEVLYKQLQQNCTIARKELNWQHEEKKLITFYSEIFNR
jgi:glycosyltransferase involved in cell wall biosynthesis